MITVWRLVTARFAATAFSGEGARLYGGRWNRKGAPMIYTAASQSLAMLEILVQDEPLCARYVTIPATLPAADRFTPAIFATCGSSISPAAAPIASAIARTAARCPTDDG